MRGKVRLKVSKADPFRKGVDIVIGKTGNKLCPVSAMMEYLAMSSKDSFFQFQDGRLLMKNRFVNLIREALGKAGYNPWSLVQHRGSRGMRAK